MVNFEDEDPEDDFEIEFSDLPPDEMVGAPLAGTLSGGQVTPGKLVTEGVHLWTRLSSVSSTLVLKGFRCLSMARTWLLSEVPVGTFADGSTTDDIELEITDLSPGRFSSASNRLTALGSRLSPRVRLWRLVIVGCTVLLALLFILGSFPSARDWLNGLFVHLTPSPTGFQLGGKPHPYTASSIQGTPGVIRVVPPEQGQAPSLLSREGTVVFWDTEATPGLAPQSQDCPARPAIDSSHEVGSSPVWVGGFEGPYATLYLYPTPVPVAAFPQAFGWTASILLEIPANSTNSITLDGANIYNGSTLLFQVDSSQEPTAYITLDSQQGAGKSSSFDTLSKPETQQRISWSVTMYFSTSGCYMLNTAWPGGQWHVNFAAGR